MAAPDRTVHHTDGVQWLRDHGLAPGQAVLTSLPDSSELKRLAFAEWREWFTSTAELIVRALPERSAAIFYQTDVKRDGAWVDKSFLVQRGIEAAGARLLWHKIVCRAPAGVATGGRPGYAHMLCASRDLTNDAERATPDVLPRLGAMTWPRAIGLEAAHAAVLWLRDHAEATCIVDPFCGIGTALAVANHHGLAAIGVEIAEGRARKARELAI
ncbi:MAG TPA: SAM-dependent methyltransferase [Planctomycetota bacterium]